MARRTHSVTVRNLCRFISASADWCYVMICPECVDAGQVLWRSVEHYGCDTVPTKRKYTIVSKASTQKLGGVEEK